MWAMRAGGFTWGYERLIMRDIAGGRRGARARRQTMAMPGADTDELARFGYEQDLKGIENTFKPNVGQC